MMEDLKGYSGDVDGVEIFRGLAIMAQQMPVAPGRKVRTPSPQISQTSQQEKEGDIEPILQRAIDVIGDREEAMRWLGTPVRALNYATPISCFHDPASRKRVLSVLTQLEHGVL
jgi:uncharacterized protein (DUF2384 family)